MMKQGKECETMYTLMIIVGILFILSSVIVLYASHKSSNRSIYTIETDDKEKTDRTDRKSGQNIKEL